MQGLGDYALSDTRGCIVANINGTIDATIDAAAIEYHDLSIFRIMIEDIFGVIVDRIAH